MGILLRPVFISNSKILCELQCLGFYLTDSRNSRIPNRLNFILDGLRKVLLISTVIEGEKHEN